MSENYFKNDKLVLYFEEDTKNIFDIQIPETRCYILYDIYEKEYFICGKQNNEDSEDFKFYCKNRKDVYTFLTNLIDKCSKVNISLYNFSDIYENAPYYNGEQYLDFNFLDTKSSDDNEIVLFIDCLNTSTMYSDMDNKLYNLLKMLKVVRY